MKSIICVLILVTVGQVAQAQTPMWWGKYIDRETVTIRWFGPFSNAIACSNAGQELPMGTFLGCVER